MKKAKFRATAVALCALCLTGYSNDIEENTPQAPEAPETVMTMQASAAGPQTHAGYTDDDQQMLFSLRSGDELGMMDRRPKQPAHPHQRR